MSDDIDLRYERSIREMQERADNEFRRLVACAWRGTHGTLRGTEWQLNERGDQLLISDLRLPHEVRDRDQHAYSSDIFLMRTTRAGRETGLASATVQVERDHEGHLIRNRTRIHELEVYCQFQGEGLGDALIGQIELQARRFGSTEIYGVFDPKGNPERVRTFYRRNGFAFRQMPDGEQVYKTLATLDNETPEQHA